MPDSTNVKYKIVKTLRNTNFVTQQTKDKDIENDKGKGKKMKINALRRQ